MKTIIHRSDSRGKSEPGWLHSRFSFSFANYYNPENMGFGLLRVLNDDVVEPGTGFGTHPHDNMEIVTIILDGELEHKDSMGSGSVIRKGEVQVMSAGTGITHSEMNPSSDEKVNLFQLWIFPKERNIKPRYDQKEFSIEERKNKLETVASGFKTNGSLYIHQDAAITLGNVEKGKKLIYKNFKPGNGSYLLVINGKINLSGEELTTRDAIGVWEQDQFEISAEENSDFVIIEVPMN
ncbi:MAG: pirin family protein [Ignavibacteriaceae bacterium]